MYTPEEDDNNPSKNDPSKENTQNPANDVETVVSNNDNMEPVPDKEQLEEKKEVQE